MLDWLSTNRDVPEGKDISPATRYASIEDHELLIRTLLDDDNAIADDAPTTPGPVFAARAFKHLIWGTPAPEEIARQRPHARRSTSEPNKTAQTPPRRTASESAKGGSLGEPSPGKQRGILLTPGTGATRRRKEVSWEGRDIAGPSLTAPTPRDIPGRFPSPWTAKKGVILTKDPKDISQKKPTSTSTSSQPRRRAASIDDITTDMTHPRSTSGTYWKSEYDMYSHKSTHEMKRLAKKEQLAKKYARHKDSEAATLAEELRHEQARVVDLEKQVSEYVSKLEVAVTELQEEKNQRRARSQHFNKGDEDAREAEWHRKANERLQVEIEKVRAERAANKAELAKERQEIKKHDELLKKKDEQIERLKAQVKAMEAQLSTLPEGTDKTASSQRATRQEPNVGSSPLPQALDGSDIWAASTRERSSRIRSRGDPQNVAADTTTYKSPARQPLSKRDVNPVASSPFPLDVKVSATTNTAAASASYRRPEVVEAKRETAAKDKTSAQTLSDERKEAAKRRLEEKKRARTGKV